MEEEEELIYSEEYKSWLSPRLVAAQPADGESDIIVPDGVVAFIRWALQHSRENTMNRLQEQYAHSPWWRVPALIRPDIPVSLEVAVIEEELLQYSFNNPLRLVEAMTHRSSSRAITGDYQRLAVCGSGLVEMLVTRMLVCGSLLPVSEFTVNQLSPHREVAAGHPDARGALGTADEMQGWPVGLHGANAAGDQPQSSCPWVCECVEDLSCAVAALCNHDAYARACVRMGLHSHILYDSACLGAAIERYVRTVHCAESQSDAAKREEHMLRHDAPRALSDVFLACAAAVLLDSNWGKFRQIFEPVIEKHILQQPANSSWLGAVNPVLHAQRRGDQGGLKFEARERTVDNTTVDELLAFIRRAAEGEFFGITSLVAPPPDAEESGRQRKQVELAFGCRDFHMYEPMLGSAGGGSIALADPVVAASPRSAERRCASFITEATVKLASDQLEKGTQGGTEFQTMVLQALGEKEFPSPGVEEREQEVQQDDEMAQLHCIYCNKWFTGPIQMKEHRDGQPHQRKMRRALAQNESKRPRRPAR